MDQPHVETLPRFATKAEFLVWEERQEPRFEFDGEDVTEVNGGTLNHIVIIDNLVAALRPRLRETPYMVWSQAKIETRGGYRYPDVSVGSRDADRAGTVLPAPIILFEVLSPSTSDVDLGRKRREYGELPSVRRYVLIESRRVGARSFGRTATGGWAEMTYDDPEAALEFPEIGVSLPMAACYDEIHF